MGEKLPGGQYRGETLKRREVAGFILTETRYLPQTRLSRHSHEHGYICLIRQGAYSETYGNQTRACQPMTVAFHPPEEVHSESFHADEVRSFNIEIGDGWLSRLENYADVLFTPADFQGGTMAWLALRLYNEFQNMDRFSPLVMEGLTLEMIAEAARRKDSAGERKTARWLERVKEILHERFAENLSIECLAHSVGVHPVYLASEFRKHYGCTVGEYIRRLRVEFASCQLGTSDTPLVDIALAAGFSDQSHFSRTFKSLTGMTPAQYRASLR